MSVDNHTETVRDPSDSDRMRELSAFKVSNEYQHEIDKLKSLTGSTTTIAVHQINSRFEFNPLRVVLPFEREVEDLQDQDLQIIQFVDAPKSRVKSTHVFVSADAVEFNGNQITIDFGSGLVLNTDIHDPRILTDVAFRVFKNRVRPGIGKDDPVSIYMRLAIYSTAFFERFNDDNVRQALLSLTRSEFEIPLYETRRIASDMARDIGDSAIQATNSD